ncbi:MAG: xanthine phosphoribosyltransferase [Erysipelotrichaceae bacterium]
MQLLKDKIVKYGEVLSGNVLKVDSFINQQIDPELTMEIGQQFYRLFKDKNITKIVTIESSGIAFGLATAIAFGNIPLIFAKKHFSVLSNNYYQTNVYSFTKKTNYVVSIEKDFINEQDNILIIDDFLANGNAVIGLVDLVTQAKANVNGIGIVIEKAFQDGHRRVEKLGYHIESLACIERFEDGEIFFR